MVPMITTMATPNAAATSLDSKWTPHGPFPRQGSAQSIFVSLCFVGVLSGGPEGIRTLDLFHAMEARSQLRHRPNL